MSEILLTPSPEDSGKKIRELTNQQKLLSSILSRESDPSTNAITQELMEKFENDFKKLEKTNEEAAKVFKLRYGIDDLYFIDSIKKGEAYTFEQIAEIMGLGVSRIKQLHKLALEFLGINLT